MPLELAFELMMMLTSGCALLVSAWLFWRARSRRSMKALAGFGVMMALWCAGHVAVFYGLDTLGMALILANPLMPTFFSTSPSASSTRGRASALAEPAGALSRPAVRRRRTGQYHHPVARRWRHHRLWSL
ncbi:hypothetical protein MBH78_00980 [Oceanimonas sp. NS1]|nr:hypothetical protein [Oceanimonas sp. NS1]